MRRVAIALGVVLLAPGAAHAATCLSSVEAFNAFMDTQPVSANAVTLSFTVTGVALDDYTNGKGWLAELADTRCNAGATASLKVYGASNPLNTAHPPGTLKLEYGSWCCKTSSCPVEYWADPMPGTPVFSQPSQVCAVTESLTPTTISYDIQCDGGPVYHADGANHDAMTITRAAVLREVAGGHAMTNASASNVKICYVLDAPPAGLKIVPVTQDVTVAPQWPTSVYPDANDLACGVGDGTTYLKFDLTALKVSSATLFVHSATDPSATGSGADIDVVADTSWSESTLAWNARPALGTRLARIDGVTPDRWYSVDVSAAISKPDTYAFALGPATTDSDTAHFLSKEASSTLRAYLLVQAESVGTDAGVADAGADAAAKGPTNLGRPVVDELPEASSGCAVVPTSNNNAGALAFALALIARRLVRRRSRGVESGTRPRARRRVALRHRTA